MKKTQSQKGNLSSKRFNPQQNKAKTRAAIPIKEQAATVSAA
jgi:hypothetical protein